MNPKRKNVTAGVVFRSAGVMLLGLGLTTVVILYAPRQYQSTAKLLLKLGRENVSLDPTVTTAGDTVALYRTRTSEVNTTLRAMHSRTILERVVDEVGVDEILSGMSSKQGGSNPGALGRVKRAVASALSQIDPIEDRERALIRLESDMSIDAERETSVVDIRYRAKDPELAQHVTECWVTAFLDEHTRMNSTAGSFSFFAQQEHELQRRLQAARDNLSQTKSQFGLVTVESKQAILQQQLAWARTTLAQNVVKRSGTEAKLKEISRLREVTSETMVTSQTKSDTNESRSRLRDQLYELELEQERLKSTYVATHPKMKAIEEQLAEARRVLQNEKSETLQIVEGSNPAHMTLMDEYNVVQLEFSQLEAESLEVQQLYDKLKNELNELNRQESTVASVQHEVDLLESHYQVQLDKLEQARLAAELEASGISSINVIQPASLERRPVSPNKKLCALLGIAGSVLAAAGIALLGRNQVVASRPTSIGPTSDDDMDAAVYTSESDVTSSHPARSIPR